MHARNFFAQAGMIGADKMRCYMSAIVILVLLFWCIFILHHQNRSTSICTCLYQQLNRLSLHMTSCEQFPNVLYLGKGGQTHRL